MALDLLIAFIISSSLIPSTPAIRKSIDEIINTDLKLKSTSANGRILVEKLIAKLSLIAKEISYAKN